jgi:hypothetical protein
MKRTTTDITTGPDGRPKIQVNITDEEVKANDVATEAAEAYEAARKILFPRSANREAE